MRQHLRPSTLKRASEAKSIAEGGESGSKKARPVDVGDLGVEAKRDALRFVKRLNNSGNGSGYRA